MEQKKYGDVVEYVKGGEALNALVAQSNLQPDGEHLTVLYLDPAFSSPLISGANLQRAIATAFVTPLKDGGLNGWKPVETLTEDQILTMQANFADAEAADERKTSEQRERADKLQAELNALTVPTLTDDEVYAQVKAGLTENGQVTEPNGALLSQVFAAVNRFLKEQSEQK
jgi:hypothetical protein